MRTGIVLLITFILLAVQYSFGLKRKKLLGAIFSGFFFIFFGFMYYMERSLESLGTGLISIVAIGGIWAMGYANASQHEKEEVEKMKKQDLK